MSMQWSNYVIRRRLDPDMWLKSRGIETKEAFYKVLSEMALDPPEESIVDGMFPAKPQVQIDKAASDDVVESQAATIKKTYTKNKKMST